MDGTKISLKNGKVMQVSGDTVNLSGITNVFGGLHIQSGGTFTVLSNAGEGKVLTSDASGNITLQPAGGGVIGATNGLMYDGTNVILGGTLTGDTEISLNSKNLKLLDEILGFDSGSGFDSTVYSITLELDGKLLVGGQFTTYSGVTVYGMIRLNNDGNVDTSFVTGGFNGPVFFISEQSDGKIVVGGQFTAYSGVTANSIIRLNTNGSVDNTFITGSGFDGYIWTALIQSDGKILCGGAFTTYSGVTANRIIRLNTNGSVDNTFIIGTGFDNGGVDSIVVQLDGKILLGGTFTSYDAVTVNYMIRLNSNGSIDTSFVTGVGFDNRVNSIAIQTDGKILCGGEFTTYSGVTANGIVRLNLDGGIDTSFVTGSGFNNADVRSISIQSNGKILVGGYFTTYSGVTANSVIRLNLDGSIDNTFVNGSGFNGGILSIMIQTDDKILVGGDFTTYSGVTANSIVRLNTDGSILNKIGITINVDGVKLDGDLGFYGTTPISKPVVSGSVGGNSALISLISALSSLGLIIDTTS